MLPLLIVIVTACAGSSDGGESADAEATAMITVDAGAPTESALPANGADGEPLVLRAGPGIRSDFCAAVAEQARTFLGVGDHPFYGNPDDGTFFGCTFADEQNLLSGPNGGEISFLYSRQTAPDNRAPACAMEEIVGGSGQSLLCTAALDFDEGVLRVTQSPSIDRTTEEFLTLISSVVDVLTSADAGGSAAAPSTTAAPGSESSVPEGAASSTTDYAANLREAAEQVLGQGCFRACEFDPAVCTELVGSTGNVRATAGATTSVPVSINCSGPLTEGWAHVDVWFEPTADARGLTIADQIFDNTGGLAVQLAEMASTCPSAPTTPTPTGVTLTCSDIVGGRLITLVDSEYVLQAALVTDSLVVGIRVSDTDETVALDRVVRVTDLLGLPVETVSGVATALASS